MLDMVDVSPYLEPPATHGERALDPPFLDGDLFDLLRMPLCEGIDGKGESAHEEDRDEADRDVGNRQPEEGNRARLHGNGLHVARERRLRGDDAHAHGKREDPVDHHGRGEEHESRDDRPARVVFGEKPDVAEEHRGKDEQRQAEPDSQAHEGRLDEDVSVQDVRSRPPLFFMPTARHVHAARRTDRKITFGSHALRIGCRTPTLTRRSDMTKTR
ncbi:MAG: hypothetical protein BWX71_02666 [Deltaproteobacteria bacterium ADurb.Bin072]|nr:MAG: hypothetical protein BWX71_02666 [Deltaproteobacteria bacterium ADurb.Bin072]